LYFFAGARPKRQQSTLLEKVKRNPCRDRPWATVPLTIGLTGGIAAGKSEALAAFERLGAATISSDAVVHELLDSEPLLGRVRERWGEDVAPEGRVDRGRIGEIVFADPEELKWLEGQIHPLVGERIGAWLGSLGSDVGIAVVEVPLLFEGEMAPVFDTTVAVVTADEVRRARAEARGHALVGEREARQLSQEEKAAQAEHVIENDGTLEDLERRLSALIVKLEG
jgi:dephospho-CoA kinase